MYYPCSENKGSASLFSHMQKAGFLTTRLICNLTYLRRLSYTSSHNLKNSSSSLFDHCQKRLKNIFELSLYDDQLDSIPNITAWFSDLTFLNLSKNHLQHLTLNDSLPLKLTDLDKSYNRFTQNPSVLHAQSDLSHLDMSGNKITSLKDIDLQGFRNLRILKLNDNPISHISFNAFTSTTLLNQIELKNTNLSQIPEALMKLGNLHVVDISGSPIKCSCSILSYLWNFDVTSVVHSMLYAIS